MRREEIIKKYALHVSQNLLTRLDQIALLENIENGWKPSKYLSLDPINENRWFLNFYGQDQNIYFSRVGNTNYFAMEK